MSFIVIFVVTKYGPKWIIDIIWWRF